jgi:hypothetical protein
LGYAVWVCIIFKYSLIRKIECKGRKNEISNRNNRDAAIYTLGVGIKIIYKFLAKGAKHV